MLAGGGHGGPLSNQSPGPSAITRAIHILCENHIAHTEIARWRMLACATRWNICVQVQIEKILCINGLAGISGLTAAAACLSDTQADEETTQLVGLGPAESHIRMRCVCLSLLVSF